MHTQKLLNVPLQGEHGEREARLREEGEAATKELGTSEAKLEETQRSLIIATNRCEALYAESDTLRAELGEALGRLGQLSACARDQMGLARGLKQERNRALDGEERGRRGEAIKVPFCPLQEKFHTFVSRGLRNIPEAP